MAQLSDRIRALMQPHLASIEPYDPNFTPCRVNLSANENTYSMPAAARASIDAALAVMALNRYPDPMSNELRAEIAAWHGVDPSWVCVGNGGDELLYNFLLAFGGPNRTLLNCPPCFSASFSVILIINLRISVIINSSLHFSCIASCICVNLTTYKSMPAQ